jgi:shikimate dehydrogenase
VVGGATRLVGLVGDPVLRSLSPRMQNAAFTARGLDWLYVPLHVEREGLETALAGLAALGFAGANVTVPHKASAVAFCDEIDDFAGRAGSVNTLVVQDGRLVGSSSDGLAVTQAVSARGARVLLVGAGGAAHAVATALMDEGAERVDVAARDPARARALAVRLRTMFPDRTAAAAERWPPSSGEATLVVNATPLTEERIVDPQPGQGIVDLAYRDDGSPTALVEAARRAESQPIVDGLELLVRQGAASFERWTDVPAPVDVMRAALATA